MTVLIVEPNKEPYVKEIDPGLESLQREVGGWIEMVYPFDDNVVIVCNEEGKIMGLPRNRALKDEEGNPYDVIFGTFIVAGIEGQYGCDICGLDESQITKYEERFHFPELFVIL